MSSKLGFKQSLGSFWSNFKEKSQGVLQKLSKSFMLPIALLPIAGLFLGIGATIETLAKNADAEAWETFGTFLKMMGDVPFANLPVLFAISVAIAFTNDAGVAGLTALIGFLIFVVVIAVFMNQGVINYNYVLAYVDDAGKDQKIVVSLKELYTGKDLIPKLTAEFSKLLGGTLGGKPIDDTFYQVISSSETPINYNLWFWKGDLAVDNKLTTSILGIGPTLNSGVFGGIIVGALVAFLYNRFYLTELPSYISFFSGVKFVPIVVFFAVIPLAFIFILIWPPVGAAFNWFGRSSGTLPVGLDSLFFGLIERSLIPFGLHHVFYAPLWWSGAGGAISDFASTGDVANPLTLTAVGDQTGFMAVIADGKLTLQDMWGRGLRLGRFQAGKFPFMMFGLPAAAAAMALTVPKENRNTALGVYASAGLTSFLTGITEPLEFSFLFVALWLFYGIHVPLAGISFMLMNVLQVKIGMIFSGGLLDWIIYGIVPSFSGQTTNWWVVPIVGAAYAAIYFFLFYFLILRFNIKIPGREAVDGQIHLFTKKDYQAAKSQSKNMSPIEDNIINDEKEKLKDKKSGKGIVTAEKILAALGGAENIENIDACASRLRVQVFDMNKVDAGELEILSTKPIKKSGKKQVAVVFGGQSDIWKNKIKEILYRSSSAENSKK